MWGKCLFSTVELETEARSDTITCYHFLALSHLPELGSLLTKDSLTCSYSLLNHGWITHIRCHRGKLESIWKDHRIITSQNGWTWKNVVPLPTAWMLPSASTKVGWQHPLLPASSTALPTSWITVLRTHKHHTPGFFISTMSYYTGQSHKSAVCPAPPATAESECTTQEPCWYPSLVQFSVDPSRGSDYSHGTDQMLCWTSSAAMELTVSGIRMVQYKFVHTGLIIQGYFFSFDF